MVLTKTIEVLPVNHSEDITPEKEYEPLLLPMVKVGFAVFGRIFPRQAARLGYRLFSTPRVRAIHKSSDEVLESAYVFEFVYGKQILKGYEWGKGEKTVLLVHGWESRGTAMRSFVPGLIDSGYRVVAFDGPAHGDSPGKRTNLPHFAGAVLAIIRHIGRVNSIITHSFGGPTSVFALAHLDNSIEIDKLVFIGVPYSTQEIARDAYRIMNLPSKAVAHFRNITAKKINYMPLEESDIWHTLGRVKAEKVLVVHDKKDNSVPFASAEKIFEKYDHASLIVTEGLGHFRLMKNPAVIDRVVKFITSDSAPN